MAVHGFLTALWLSGAALMLALLEIEIEGASGWAARLPTVRLEPEDLPALPRAILGILFGRKPVTLYHLHLVGFVLIAFHGAFFLGAEWTWAGEARLLSSFVLFWLTEDFLWFVMNPAYGLAEFRRGRVWWHDLDGWAVDRIPKAFVKAMALSLALALASDPLHGALQWVMVALNALVCVIACVSLAPKYHAWRRRMLG